MFCIHCGKAIPDDAMFCPFCGKATTVKVAPKITPFHAQQPSSPTPSVVPPAPSPEPNEIAATEPNLTAEAEPVSGPELSDPEHDTAAKYRVTFMRWDTSGPELTITFSQGDPLVLSSMESRTILLTGGTQHISLDTASGHSEFEILLDADHKVDLRWNAETGLFSADCKVHEKFKSTTASAKAELPAQISAATVSDPIPSSTLKPQKSIPAETVSSQVSPPAKKNHTGILILVAVLIIAVAIVAAFFLSREPSSAENRAASAGQALQDKIQYLDSLILTDYVEGTTELRAYFKFTNTTDEITSPNFDMSVVAFQNGVSLPDLWDDSDWGAMLQPGHSMEGYKAFELSDDTSPVELVVYGSFMPEGINYSVTVDLSTFGASAKGVGGTEFADEYPYELAGNMDDILTEKLWGETAFLDAVDEGWGWDWLWNYTGFGSADVDYVPEPLWYNESLGEWTIYGVTYDHACDVGWGSAWLQLMSEMS